MSISEYGLPRWARWTSAGMLVCLAMLLNACAHTASRSTLYQDLGGERGVALMIDEIVVELHADPKLADLFTETDDDYFKERLNEQICMLTGGGCEYTGLDMPEAHSGMDLSAAQFNDFVEACRRAMTRAGVQVGNQNRLLAILAPMRADVIHQ
ncbi:MAG: group 1 truncated hemoglobin [Ahniella sp.]|nr:group 1 truncated hemoglobin [Ahniella sp.]